MSDVFWIGITVVAAWIGYTIGWERGYDAAYAEVGYDEEEIENG